MNAFTKIWEFNAVQQKPVWRNCGGGVVAGLAAGEELKGAVPRRLEGQVTAIGPMRLLPLYAAKPATRGRCVWAYTSVTSINASSNKNIAVCRDDFYKKTTAMKYRKTEQYKY